MQVLAEKVRKDYAATVLIEVLVWPAWQIFTFRLVPLRHQLMVSNLLSLGEAVALPLAKSTDSWLSKLSSSQSGQERLTVP